MIKRQHILFNHGPLVGSHSAGLAGVVGCFFALFRYFFFFAVLFSFAWLFQLLVCSLFFIFFFISRVVVLSFVSFFREED